MFFDISLRSLRPFALTLLVVLAACGGGSGGPTTPPPVDEPEPEPDVPVSVPARGTSATFDVATWNIEWFGSTGNGPADETTQLRRVRDVINGAQIDLWGVQEIVGETAFSDLLSELPGYSGLLANAPSVTDGPAYYSDFSNSEQKVGIIWRDSEFSVDSASIVLKDRNYEFAGRPPLEIRGRITVGSNEVPVIVLVLHAKASTDQESWTRRRDGAAAMKAWLDSAYPDDRVFVIGDFNDDLDESIRTGAVTPYQNFLDDRDGWRFVTEALAATGQGTHVNFDTMIDHVLTTNEAFSLYQAESAEIFRLDGLIQNFGDSTSDHYPVLARFNPGG